MSRNWREKMPAAMTATTTTTRIGATKVASQRGPSGALVRKPSSFSRATPIAPNVQTKKASVPALSRSRTCALSGIDARVTMSSSARNSEPTRSSV